MTIPTLNDLLSINFDKFKKYTKDLPKGYDWLYGKPGQEHYKLLAWFSTQYPQNTILCDVGTYKGLSALALSYNTKCNVVSYDIADSCDSNIKKRKNIKFVIEDALNNIDSIIKSPFIFLDIDPHDGVQEDKFVKELIKKSYKGVVLVDDTTATNVGTSNWWKTITLPKEDLSYLGHKTGTGMIYFK